MNKSRFEMELEKREAFRAGINVEKNLKRIQELSDILRAGYEVVLDGGVERQIPLDSARTTQLKEARETSLALVKLVLPVPKQVELTGAGGEELANHRVMSEIELRNRLRAVLTSQPPVLLEHQPEEDTTPDCLR